MKTIKKTIKKVILISVIFVEIMMINMSPVNAGLFGGGGIKIDVNKMLGQMEQRYHINQGSVQDFAEGFNVSSQKTMAPEVKLSFSVEKPDLGEKITATALPTNFQDGEKDLYFSWYLKHKKCGETNSPNAEELRLCDADGDKNIDANDWKVEAMRIIATNGFNRNKADYTKDTDDDGFRPEKGGNNNVQNDYCYVNDRYSGTDYEVAFVSNAGGGSSVDCAGDVVCGISEIATCLTGSVGFPAIDPLLGAGGGSEPINMVDAQVINDSGSDPFCDPNSSRITCPTGTTPMCILDSNYLNPTCDFISSLADLSSLATANGADTDIACTTEAGTAAHASSRCEHQFADGHGTIGDGSFGLNEEIFWGTDPNNPSTAGNGNTDEANLAGLGVNTLTWSYLPGDEVGVIIEGSSFIGTKHDDSSKEISFALPKNIFDKDGTACQISDKRSYVKRIRGYDVVIPAATIDLDECLKYNLIDPTNGDFASNLKTELSYYPSNPNVGGVAVNGSSTAGDVLTISANTANLSSEDAHVYYKWSVYGTTRSRDDISLLSSSLDGWNELSNDSVFREDNGIEVLEGLGMSDFKIQLNNLDSNIKYLRFYVDVEEFYGEDGSGSSGKTNTGRSDVIVRVNNSSADGGIDLYVGATLICNTSVGACEVLNNQIVTAKINGGDARNFLWSLNGKQINYLPAGETKQGDEVKFLVQGDLGSTFVLNVIANDTESVVAAGPKNTGEKLNLTRNLVIVQSMIGLGPNNELNRTNNAVCGTLNGGSAVNASVGTYNTNSVAIDGSIQAESLPDCRETYYDANGIVDVPATYYPSFIEADGATAKYYVNGVEQADGHIDLSGFEIGSLVTVTVKAQYSPVKSVGDLAKDWGVTQLQSSTPETMTDTIYIKVTDPAMGVKKPSKIIAGLAYNLPTQMIFIFRIMLTAMVIVFTSGVLMSLTKKRYNN